MLVATQDSPRRWLEQLIARSTELSDRSRTTTLRELEDWKSDAGHCLLRLGLEMDPIREQLAKLKFQGPMVPGTSLAERQQEHYYRTLAEAIRLLEDARHIAQAREPISVSGAVAGPPMARFPTPAGAGWADVSLRFTSEFQAQITVAGRTEVRNYAEMGFEDRRREIPDSAWELLRKFAENGGTIGNSQQANGAPWPVVEKRVQILRKRLRQLFQIPDDPFEPYRRAKCYRAKFHIESARACQA